MIKLKLEFYVNACGCLTVKDYEVQLESLGITHAYSNKVITYTFIRVQRGNQVPTVPNVYLYMFLK